MRGRRRSGRVFWMLPTLVFLNLRCCMEDERAVILLVVAGGGTCDIFGFPCRGALICDR
jgi:hypothetical protein